MVNITSIDEVKTEEVHMDGVYETKVQWLIDDKSGGKNFAMRRFILAKGGIINLHTHDWEHEVFILSGNGEVLSTSGNKEVGYGDVVLVEPGEAHGFKNTGDEEFIFLCMIPLSG